MSDTLIFLFGTFVTVVVGIAVGLLLWGASNEPRDEPAPLQADQASSLPDGPVRSPAREASYTTDSASRSDPEVSGERPVAAFGGASPRKPLF